MKMWLDLIHLQNDPLLFIVYYYITYNTTIL